MSTQTIAKEKDRVLRMERVIAATPDGCSRCGPSRKS